MALFLLTITTIILRQKGTTDSETSTPTQVATFVRTAELSTVEYTITKMIKANDIPEWYKIGDRKILFSCRATLKAGLDMSQFTDDDVQISPDHRSITITLAQPRLLNLNINPKDIRVEYENVDLFRSRFTAEDRQKLLVQGEKAIRADINSIGILDDARKNATQFFQTALENMGYEKVTIKF